MQELTLALGGKNPQKKEEVSRGRKNILISKQIVADFLGKPANQEQP